MSGLNDTARYLFVILIVYQLVLTMILGWQFDIRDAFFEIRTITLLSIFMMFMYGSDGYSPLFIIVSIITFLMVCMFFYNDPRDTHPGSLHNIFKQRNTFGYDPNRC